MLYGSFLLLAQYDFLFKPNQYVALGVIGMAIKMSCICLRAERDKFPSLAPSMRVIKDWPK